MNNLQKNKIKDAILGAKATGKSQNAIATITGVSSANITQIVKGNWDKISDELWRKVASSLNVSLDTGWQTARITNYKKIWGVCKVAQNQSSAKIISFDAGFGKTYTLTEYAKNNENVFYLQCDRYFTKKVFLQKFAKSLGLQVVGSTAEMIDEIIERLKTMKSPLIIWDEYDKVLEKSGVFDLFKTFYDSTLGFCGFVLCGATALENTLKKCVAKNKIGYVELYSRCGREFISLKHLTQADIIAICLANGIDSEQAVQNIKIKLGNGDLRQLKSIIEHYKLEKEL